MKIREVTYKVYLIATFLFGTSSLTACECLKLQPFLDNISKDTRVSRIRIIDHGNINMAGNEKSNYDIDNLTIQAPPSPPIICKSFTKIAIIDNFLGEQLNDTLLFLNDYRGSCSGHLGYAKIGSEFVIRYNEIPANQPDIEEIRQSLNSSLELITASDCINWKLKASKTKVIGNIFTSKRAEEVKKLHDSFEEYTEEEREMRYAHIKNIKEEEIEYVTLIRKLKEIKHTIYNKQ